MSDKIRLVPAFLRIDDKHIAEDAEPKREANRKTRYMIISIFSVFLALKYHNGYNEMDSINILFNAIRHA